MIRPAGDVSIHLYAQPVDMRKAIYGLVSIVKGEMDSDPFSADLYIFCNRARTLVKLVAWEVNVFCLWMKQLEKSRFKWPLSGFGSMMQLTAQEINWSLEGCPLMVTQANGSMPQHRVLKISQQVQDNDTKDATAELPTSVAELRQLAPEQQRQLEQQSLFIDQLLEQIRLARLQYFGVRIERFSLNQLELAFNEVEVSAAGIDDPDALQADLLGTIAVPRHRRARGGRRPLPKTFPRVEIVYEIDEGDFQCGACKAAPTPISAKVTEQLDIQPARVQVLRHVRGTDLQGL